MREAYVNYQDGDLSDFTAWLFDVNEAKIELQQIIESAKAAGYQLNIEVK